MLEFVIRIYLLGNRNTVKRIIGIAHRAKKSLTSVLFLFIFLIGRDSMRQSKILRLCYRNYVSSFLRWSLVNTSICSMANFPSLSLMLNGASLNNRALTGRLLLSSSHDFTAKCNGVNPSWSYIESSEVSSPSSIQDKIKISANSEHEKQAQWRGVEPLSS